MSFENPKIVVVGAGAMGGLFGGLLAEGGLDVTLVDAWPEHIAAIRQNGLRIVGVGGDRAIKVKATTDASEIRTADVVLFQCKAFANEAAANSVKHLFGGATVAITFQNGLGNEQTLGAHPGREERARRADRAGRTRRRRRAWCAISATCRPISARWRAGCRSARSRSPRRSPRMGCRSRPAPTSSARSGRSCSATWRSARSRRSPTCARSRSCACPSCRRSCSARSTRRRRSRAREGVALDVAEAREVLMRLVDTSGGGTGNSKSSMREDIIRSAAAPRSTPSTARSRGSRGSTRSPTPTIDTMVGDGEGPAVAISQGERDMDFALSDEQRLLVETARRFVRSRADAAREGAGGEARARPREGARDLREVEGARPLRGEHPGRAMAAAGCRRSTRASPRSSSGTPPTS